MASPVDVSADTHLRQVVERHAGSIHLAALALASASGIAGLLVEPRGDLFDRVGLPLAFALALTLFAASPSVAVPAGAAELRRGVRRASTRIYLILYALFALKELQFAAAARALVPAPARVMQGLWPYLAAGVVALVLVRMRGARR